MGNITWTATDAQFLEFFRDCNPTSAVVKRRQDQTSRGFGFADFANENDMNTAIQVFYN